MSVRELYRTLCELIQFGKADSRVVMRSNDSCFEIDRVHTDIYGDVFLMILDDTEPKFICDKTSL